MHSGADFHIKYPNINRGVFEYTFDNILKRQEIFWSKILIFKLCIRKASERIPDRVLRARLKMDAILSF